MLLVNRASKREVQAGAAGKVGSGDFQCDNLMYNVYILFI